MPRIRLRDATTSDLVLTYTITEDAMRAYVEQTWGSWDPDEQFQKHRDNFTPETHSVILADDDEIGFVAVEDLPTYLWLVKMYLFASHRNRGIGSQILKALLHRAETLGKPVRLRVLRVNASARRLYERHGFKVIDETAQRLFMQSGA